MDWAPCTDEVSWNAQAAKSTPKLLVHDWSPIVWVYANDHFVWASLKYDQKEATRSTYCMAPVGAILGIEGENI